MAVAHLARQAGFSFSRSHATKRVPYDPHTAYLFHGEEFSRGARLWTHGYDFYSPSENFVLHHYGRKVPLPSRPINTLVFIKY